MKRGWAGTQPVHPQLLRHSRAIQAGESPNEAPFAEPRDAAKVDHDNKNKRRP
jgi:hypothetical protein